MQDPGPTDVAVATSRRVPKLSVVNNAETTFGNIP